MSKSFDAIIIGLGAMGSSAAYHLAKRGVRVLGLEQFAIPHALGSSHGQSRMIRMAYYEHPDYVPLLRCAYDLWRQLEAESNRKLLFEVGGIYMGPPEGEVVSGSRSAAELHHLEHELLDCAELKRRFPQFRLPEDFIGLFETRAGFLLPEQVITAQADLAFRAGAQLHGNEPVLQWSCDQSGATVRTTQGEYHGERLLFCGGAWTSKLLEDLNIQLRVTRQAMGWIWPANPSRFEFGRFPVWGIDNPDGSLSYGFPFVPGDVGLKVARHAPGALADPDSLNREAAPEDHQQITGIINNYLPDAFGPISAIRICMYTNSPDSHFIIDRHPTDDRIHLAAGFSGHGFKFASVIGEILADLAQTGKTNHPIDFLKLSRF